jgi:hypothetical protein
MVRGARETAMSALSFGLVLIALVSFDPRVRVRFWSVFSDPAGAALSPLGDRLGDLGNALWVAVREQSIDNAPWLIFSVVGIALVFFLFRS